MYTIDYTWGGGGGGAILIFFSVVLDLTPDSDQPRVAESRSNLSPSPSGHDFELLVSKVSTTIPHHTQ